MATREHTVAEGYLEQPYEISLVRRTGDDGMEWTAQVVELPGCEARGASEEEALASLRAAMVRWIDDANDNDRVIPPPKAASGHSGRLLVRMPPALHSELARMADREKVSLNTLIVGLLGGATSWQRPGVASNRDVPAPGGERAFVSQTDTEPEPRERMARLAFAAGLAVSALAAVVAVILVVVVLTG